MSEAPTTLYVVKQLGELVDALAKMPPTDDELADVIGHMGRIETKLATTRRAWERITHELPPIPKHDRTRRVKRETKAGTPTVQGQEFELVPQYTTKRSYNTPAILVAISAVTGWDTWRSLLEAQRADAVRLTWRWTDLKALLHDLEVPLRTVYVEVDDDTGTDGGMVGEVKKQSGVKKVPIVDKAPPVEAVPDPTEPDAGE